MGRGRQQGSNAGSSVDIPCAILHLGHDGGSCSVVTTTSVNLQLRWSWGVKLLSQADDEVPDVDSAPLPQPATNSQTKLSNGTAQIAQSPESLIPHPGARETDPFFSTHARMSQDEVDERRNPTRNIDGTMRRDQSPDPAHSPDPSVQWTTGAASAHSMRPAGTRRGSSMSRHSGSVPPGMRRKPTRTDSAREFWGLPEEPRRHRIMLPEDVREDSSDESDEEWVSPVFGLGRDATHRLFTANCRGVSPLCLSDDDNHREVHRYRVSNPSCAKPSSGHMSFSNRSMRS